MKFLVLFLILIVSGLMGLLIKNKYKNQKEILEFISNFLDYLYLNISIYKNNIIDIINNYKIQQKNKNAKYVNIFQNLNNIQLFNENFVKNYFYNIDYFDQIKLFFNSLGTNIKEEECEKIKQLNETIKGYIIKTNEDVKTKGDLYFKLCLTLGVVIDIILW